MSGPKVVRIVTREEIEAICRRHLAIVQAATADLRGKAKKLGLLDEALEGSLLTRNRQLTALFDAAQWMELQERAPEAVTSLRAEASRLQEQVVLAEMAARDRRRRLVGAAQSVAAALASAGVDVPQRLQQAALRGVGPGAEAASKLEGKIAKA